MVQVELPQVLLFVRSVQELQGGYLMNVFSGAYITFRFMDNAYRRFQQVIHHVIQ